MRRITCSWCAQEHTPRFLCDPAAELLRGITAEAAANTTGSIDFETPLSGAQLGIGTNPGDRLIRQLVVQPAVTEVLGVPRATLIFTGRALDGTTLPRWLYIGDDGEVRAVAALVTDRADHAIRTAAAQRGG